MRRALDVAAALIVGISFLCPVAQAQGEHESAVWKAQQAHLDYVGFTTLYTCDGLRDKVRQVLHILGAGKGYKVTALGCNRDKPAPLPAVDIGLSTLKRSDEPGAIDAVWKSVELGGGNGLSGGDCELAEQIVQKILPLFEVRKVHMSTACTPHQMPTGNLSLTLEVLSEPTAP